MHGGAFAAGRRLLDLPTSMARAAQARSAGCGTARFPDSEGASAVAFTQYRLRCAPRGRASMFTPVIIPLVLLGLAYRRGGGLLATKSGGLPFSFFSGGLGLSLAAFGSFAAILALIPLALNQFAVDKAGFTRQMLSPLSVRELLTGKAVGNALVALAPALFCFVLPALIFPGGPPALWLSLLLSVISTYVLFAPAAAAWSAIFPKDVDLNSIGNSGNAHQLAGLLGMPAIVAAAPLPDAFAVAYLQRINLAPPSCCMGGSFALSQLIFIPVRKQIASRCETIAQY